jgi:hypothetical protein
VWQRKEPPDIGRTTLYDRSRDGRACRLVWAERSWAGYDAREIHRRRNPAARSGTSRSKPVRYGPNATMHNHNGGARRSVYPTPAAARCAQPAALLTPLLLAPVADEFSYRARGPERRPAIVDEHPPAGVIQHTNRHGSEWSLHDTVERCGSCIALIRHRAFYSRRCDAPLKLHMSIANR